MANINLDRVGWQDGTLISKAKVEIDDTIYDVEPEQYSGQTPLSSANLKKMEDNTEKAINEVNTNLNDKINGTTLYDNAIGTSGNVTLSDSAENYEYIEIYYRTGNRSNSTKVQDFTNKNLTMQIIAASPSTFVCIVKQISISGNTITKVQENQFYTNSSGSTTFTTTDTIYIYKVVGYK